MYMVQGVLCVLLCWVCCLIKSDQLGELPSPSARRLCVYLKMNLTVKNKALGKLIRKIVVGKVLPNMFFFCLGLAKIVFQLDAVKFAMLFWVSRLEKQVIRCVAFAKCKA